MIPQGELAAVSHPAEPAAVDTDATGSSDSDPALGHEHSFCCVCTNRSRGERGSAQRIGRLVQRL